MVNCSWIGRRWGWLAATAVAVAVLTSCSGESDEDASPGSSPSAGVSASASSLPTASPPVVTATSGPPSPASSPTPLPSSAYPPLAGFGEVHDIGTVVTISDGADGTVLSLDRSAYVHCIPQADDPRPCLDGYRIDDVEPGTLDYVVAPTVTFTYSVEPEVYETGDLEDLREFVPAHPSNLMMLQLDAGGTVVAVGDPWLP